MVVNVKITTELKNPTDVGVHYRLLCMTGPNKGKVYYLKGKRVTIGRGENADIQIVDSKISREHAELSFAEKIYTITDLGAQNGVIVNDEKIKQKKLINNEKIVIGQTVFKYNVIEVLISQEMVLAEATPDSPLAREIKKGVKVKLPSKMERNEIDEGYRSQQSNGAEKEGSKSRALIFGVVILSVIFVLFGGSDKQVPSKKISRTTNSGNDFEEMPVVKSRPDDPEVTRKLSSLVHSGRREFREGNYFRAMEEFRLALLLSPNNGQASFYLSKAKQSLDDEIKKNFEKGSQEQDAKKYQAAIVSFCGVLQLIKEYPDDERYKTAKSNLSAIESSLGMEKGEIKCFEEEPTNSRD